MEKLQDLTLLNKFLFDQTMDIPEAQEAALQIVLQDEKSFRMEQFASSLTRKAQMIKK